MTTAARDAPTTGVVLDIEGTTTPVSFVYDVLFPYARAQLRAFLSEHAIAENQRRDVIAALRREWADDASRGERVSEWRDENAEAELASVAGYVEWLMDRDRKSPALKLAQGLIWERGYCDGTLRGEVYADVRPALERWHHRGLGIAIYSSGSVLAQRLLFAHSTAGDLTRFIDHYFDTSVGPKHSRGSYARIASEMNRAANELMFISDVQAELQAATDAGFRSVLCVRSAAAYSGDSSSIRSFGEVDQLFASQGGH